MTPTTLLASLCLLAPALGGVIQGGNPEALPPWSESALNETQIAVDPAVRFTSYGTRTCGGTEDFYRTPDVNCYQLPGIGLRIREIAPGCRSEIDLGP